MNLRALLRVIDFFIPIEVLSAVLMVFALENVIDYYFTLYVPEHLMGRAWLAVYIVGLLIIAGLNLAAADEDELDELEEDVIDLRK